MSDDLRARADARLEAALAAGGVRDPRPYFRPILKHLRERDAASFQQALEHFESTLIPAVATEGDPLAEWLSYGRLLAELAGEGRLVAIDGSGRAEPAEAAPGSDALVVYLPEAAETPAMVLRCPADATAAQEASIELLVLGRLAISDRLSAMSAQESGTGA